MAYQTVGASYVMNHLDVLPVVDVRPRSMFAQGHIPGAINIPFDEVRAAGEDDMAAHYGIAFDAAGIGKHNPAIVSCQAGMHAQMVCDMLDSLGFDSLKWYKGSWQDWAANPSHPQQAGAVPAHA